MKPALAGAAMVPVAAVRTAGAVRDLSDSSLIVRLTRGRSWIAVLCALLGGIVALNVVSLSLNAGSGRVGQQVAELEQENSALRAQLAEGLSAGQVEDAAARLGLTVPDPDAINYVNAHDGDADRLAELLDKDTFLTSDPTSYVTPSAPASSNAPTTSAPATSAPAPSPAPAPQPAPSGGSSGGSSSDGTGGVGL
jgi:hypothetical protein